MTSTLFALVKRGQETSVRRVPVNSQVHIHLDALFETQERSFVNDIENQIKFDGMYKPDAEEILYIDDAKILSEMTNTLSTNTTSYDILAASGTTNLPAPVRGKVS